MERFKDERWLKRERNWLTYREVRAKLSVGAKVCAEDFERTLFVDDPDERWQLQSHQERTPSTARSKSAWRHYFARHPELRPRAVLAQAYDAQQGRIR
jgi:hypothetical protein